MAICGANIVIAAKLQKRSIPDKEIRTASRGYSAYNELYHMLGSKANNQTMPALIWNSTSLPGSPLVKQYEEQCNSRMSFILL